MQIEHSQSVDQEMLPPTQPELAVYNHFDPLGNLWDLNSNRQFGWPAEGTPVWITRSHH